MRRSWGFWSMIGVFIIIIWMAIACAVHDGGLPSGSILYPVLTVIVMGLLIWVTVYLALETRRRQVAVTAAESAAQQQAEDAANAAAEAARAEHERAIAAVRTEAAAAADQAAEQARIEREQALADAREEARVAAERAVNEARLQSDRAVAEARNEIQESLRREGRLIEMPESLGGVYTIAETSPSQGLLFLTDRDGNTSIVQVDPGDAARLSQGNEVLVQRGRITLRTPAAAAAAAPPPAAPAP